MGTGDPQTAETKPRLSRRDRRTVLGISFLALAAAGSALLSMLASIFHLFGDEPSPREIAVAGQSAWVALWALATPFCCWAVLRGGRKALAGATAWLVLLGFCRWWWWPSPPRNDLEKLVQPLWGNFLGILPWALVAASLTVGVVAARRSPARNIRQASIALTIGIVLLAGVSFINVLGHAQDEEPTPLAEGSAELAALKGDAFWTALPGESITLTDEHAAALSDWGEKFPTWKRATLGNTQDTTLFERAISAAESSGWMLHNAICGADSAAVTFTKSFPQGPAYVRIALAPYIQGVEVFMSMARPLSLADPERCWESL